MERLTKIWDWSRPSKKYIYFFHEGSADDANLLGNKGAHLCEMHRLGLPVPSGWILSTEACNEFFAADKRRIDDSLLEDIRRSVRELERGTGKVFFPDEQTSSLQAPLLLSVRSGAPVSMPGMMNTVLNVGMNDAITDKLARITNNRKWAYDTYRRFLQMFGDVVLGIDKELYENILKTAKDRRNIVHENELDEAELKFVIEEFKKLIYVPEDPWTQLTMSIEAIFMSWNSARAIKYRDLNNIPDVLGTGAIVQAMVFGNLNDCSGSGVAFSRNPTTGEKGLFGEYLPNAEGEDVVAGIRTPLQIADLRSDQASVYDTLEQAMKDLEIHYRDMQDVEFTVENGILYILQTRRGKRSPQASVRIAVSMVKEKLISEREAVLRLRCSDLKASLHPMLDPKCSIGGQQENEAKERIVGKGLAASGGAVIGQIVFTCSEAENFRANNLNCILCKEFTSADDISGLNAANGVLTSRGGMTSHASVVMRGMGKTAVIGAQDIIIDAKAQELRTKDNKMVISRGDVITIDGSTGLVYVGEMPTITPIHDEEFQTILHWADKYKRMQVLANADTAEDVKRALELGAEGVGLCRTEHMFFQADRINLFRQLLLTESEEARKHCLQSILPLQQQDFLEIFRAAENQEVVIRLLDAPLHEFLPDPYQPDYDREVEELAGQLKWSVNTVRTHIARLCETNPMMGCRGCRQAIVHPDIMDMQTRAIVGAYLQAHNEGVMVRPQIMLPMVFSNHEIDAITPVIMNACRETCKQQGHSEGKEEECLDIGAMLELPRACLRAEKIVTAQHMKFVSFGTNDLTQMVFGLSRDDTEQFMPLYLQKHLVAKDPFVTLDIQGVGTLMQVAVSKIRSTGANTQIGVCGEHAADPASVSFFNNIGVDYISCSKFSIPMAKLAAAQAHIKELTNQRESWGKHVWDTARTIVNF